MKQTDSLTALGNALSPPRAGLGGWRSVLALLLLLLGIGRAHAQAPVLASIEGTTLSYTQGQAATQITNTLTVTDPDNAVLTGGRVAISSGFVAGQDNLDFVNQNGISGSYNTGNGILTMTSPSGVTLATYQAALRSIRYRNSNTTTTTLGNRSVQFTVSDGVNTSNALTRVVNVIAFNSTPVVTTTSGTTTFIIGGGAVAIDNGLTVTDADNTTLASATVRITSGLQSGQDVLLFTNTNTTTFGNIGSAASANGTLPLTSSGGTATVAQWQAALRTVTFNNSVGTAPTTVRTVEFVVNDGTTASAPATKTITFAPATTVVSVTRLTPSPTATTQVRYQVVFSRSVSGVTVSNFSVTNTGTVTGTNVSSAVGSGTTYTVTVNTGTGTGTLRLNVNNSAGITPTVSGLPFTAGETYTITKSFPAQPQLTIVGTGGQGSDVTAFVDAVQVLSGSTAFANALQNGSFEQHDPLSNGDFGYQPTSASWTFNTRAGIAESGSAFTPITPIPNGIAVAYIQTIGSNNGQIQQNLVLPTGTGYTVSFQAAQRLCCTTLDQSLNVFLNGVFLGNIQPIDGNGYTAFTSAPFAVSAPALTATVSTTSASPTTTAPIPFSVTFSQSVGSTFTDADVTVTGGTLTAGSFASSGNTYTFTVTPTGTGTVSVRLAAAVAQDANSTGNAASNTVSVQYAQPVTAAPVITSPVNGTLTNQPVAISGTAPAGSEVTVYVNQNGAAFQDLGTYTATAGGTFSTPAFPFPGATYQTYATAQSPGAAVSANSATITFIIDTVQPTVAISSTAGSSGGTTGTSPIPFTVTFSENVTGFVAGDVTVTNGTISGFTGSGTTYTFNVTPTTAGNATTVNVPANVAVDPAGNGNTVATQYSITYGQPVTAAPVVLTPADGTVTNQSIIVTGTAPANSSVVIYFSQNGGAYQQLPVTATASGTFSSPALPFPSGSYRTYATAQSPNEAVSANSNLVNYTVDQTAPTVAITSTAGASGGTTTTTPIPFTVTFSEPVTGFLAGDVTVTNGTIGTVSGTGTTYTFTVTPTTAGTATTVNVPASVAQDAVGNGNAPSNTYSLTYQLANLVWNGSLSTDWFTAGNWTPAQVPTSTTNATIPTAPSGGRFPAITTTTATVNVRNLSLNSGATLTQTDGTLALAGNLTNNGTFQPTGGTVSMGGTALSSILGSGNTRFWNLSVAANGAQLSTSASTSMQRVLTLNGNFLTNGNPFTLESNASGTAMVVNNAGNAVSGNVTVQRYITPDLNPNLGYRHVSAPISSATVSSLATGSFTPVVNPAYNTSATPSLTTPFPTVYGYDQARLATTTNNLNAFDKGWYSPASTADALTVGQGYTVLIGGGQTWNFFGLLNNGNVTQALARNSGATAPDAGYALVGNPYPSPLNWSLVDATDRPGVGNTMYVYNSNDPSNPYTGFYGFYNASAGLGTISPVVAQGQGFFVQVAAGQTSGSVTFKNTQRPTTYASPTYQRPTETRPLVELHLQGTGSPLSDAAFVYFEQGATAGFDAQYDTDKLANPSGLNLSTILSATQRLAIDGRAPLGTTTVTVPLAVGVPAAGAYTLSTAQLLNLGTTPVYLRDLQSAAVIDLRQQPSYAFTVSNASALLTGRFELVFSPQAVLATAPAALAAQVGLYPNPATATAFVELPAALGHTAVAAELVDVLGRPVRAQLLPAQGAAPHRLDLVNLATGVYTLHLRTSAGVVVKKLVVQ